MTSRNQSSGDLLADRRFAYGLAAAAEGDDGAAADLFAQALERAPDWAAGWFALGEAQARLGDRDAAAAAFHKSANHDPAGELGAPLALAALGAAGTPAGAAPNHVRALFDEYAPRFEAHLTGALSYRAPAVLAEALRRTAPDRHWRRVFDLGCGTGLMGEAMRAQTEWLGGVDLSPAMVAQARRKKLYDTLIVGEMAHTLAANVEPFDLVLAADVLVYIGDLAPILRAVAGALLPGGMFAFSVQRGSGGSGVQVGADRRFTHARDHVLLRAADGGWTVQCCDETSTRRDAGADVPGLVVVLTR